MHSRVETLEDDRVKLTVEIDEAEFEPEIEAAFKRIAHHVRLPGFRPGRAPRRLLEARLGRQAGRDEALSAALMDYCARALTEQDVDAIDVPQIEVIEGVKSGPVRFEAVVGVRPTVEISGYDSLRVEIPSPVVDEAEIDAEIDEIRKQYAELSPVGRPARDGDHMRIDISCTFGGEIVDGLTTSDYDYLLGMGAVVPEIDQNLRGSSPGHILDFDAAHPNAAEPRRLFFRVLVKEVLETVLPELDDDFASANSEHDTVEEMRAALRAERAPLALLRAATARHDAISDAVVGLVSSGVPQSLVDIEFAASVKKITGDEDCWEDHLEDHLASTGESREAFVDRTREGALRAAKLDLALRAVVAAEGLRADDAAVEKELRESLSNPGRSVTEEHVAAAAVRIMGKLASSGDLPSVRSEVSKHFALQWIIARTVLVDPSGAVVDPESLDISRLSSAHDDEEYDDEEYDDEDFDEDFDGGDFDDGDEDFDGYDGDFDGRDFAYYYYGAGGDEDGDEDRSDGGAPDPAAVPAPCAAGAAPGAGGPAQPTPRANESAA